MDPFSSPPSNPTRGGQPPRPPQPLSQGQQPGSGRIPRSSLPGSPPPPSSSSSSAGASFASPPPPSSYRQPAQPPRPPLLQFTQSNYDDSRGGSFATYASADPFATPGQPQPQRSFQSVSFQESEQPKRMSSGPQPGQFQSSASQSQRFSTASAKSRPGSMGPQTNKDGATSRTSLIGPPSNRPISGSSLLGDPEAGGFSAANPNSDMRRKRSLVRPDRERMDPNHRQWYYRNHAAQMDTLDSQGGPARTPIGFAPSTTGHLPQHGAAPQGMTQYALQGPGGGVSGLGVAPMNLPPGGLGRAAPAGG
ncbi:Chitin synthase, class 3, partial [Tilletia horrida]